MRTRWGDERTHDRRRWTPPPGSSPCTNIAPGRAVRADRPARRRGPDPRHEASVDRPPTGARKARKPFSGRPRGLPGLSGPPRSPERTIRPMAAEGFWTFRDHVRAPREQSGPWRRASFWAFRDPVRPPREPSGPCGDLPGPGPEPAVRGHVARDRGPGRAAALRARRLRPRRDGGPGQGTTAAPVRRPDRRGDDATQ